MKHLLLTSVCLAAPLFAQAGNMPTFSNKDGLLSIPQLQVDGALTYYNAQLQLDFASGTFKLRGASARPDVIQITLGQIFSLKSLQYAALPGTPLRLHFLGAVQDSRCPIDALCIQAGSVTVGLEILSGEVNGGEFSLTLGADPASAVREFDGYRLTLLEVTPTPRSDVTRRPEDYEIALRLDAVAAQ